MEQRFDSKHYTGLKWSKFDTCLHLRPMNSAAIGYIILVFYVDDMSIAIKDRFEVDKLKAQLIELQLNLGWNI